MRSRLSILTLALIGLWAPAGPARGGSAGSESDQGEGRRIDMGHYSFVLPGDGEWRVERPGGPYEHVVLEKELGEASDTTRLLIRLFRGTITKKSYVRKSAQWHAANLFGIEREIMEKEGVAKGLYELNAVSTGEEEVAGRRFFCMDYETETATDVQPSALYLFFPHDKHNEWFLMVHYRQAVPKTTGLSEPAKASVLELLGTLEIEGDGST